ncbi:MAG: DNA photolyase, partial [Gammaproteobacteria bacterium]
MTGTLSIEKAVADHPRALEIQRRLPAATRIYCDRYTEIFNRKAQNFRLQKKRPALILAAKFRQRLLPVPATYDLGARHNYYFSHMLNCIY